MCAAGGSATWASAVTGGAVRGGWMPSRWAQRRRMTGSSPAAAGRDSSASSSVGEREPGAFGGDPLDAVGDGAAGDEVRSAGVMEGLGWFAA